MLFRSDALRIDPIAEATIASPENHKVLLENEEVRVLEVSIAPGSREHLHVHRYPSVIYLESSPNLIEHLQDGSLRDLGVRPKGVRWLPIAQGHYLEDVDTFPLRAIRIELKKARWQVSGKVRPYKYLSRRH